MDAATNYQRTDAQRIGDLERAVLALSVQLGWLIDAMYCTNTVPDMADEYEHRSA